MTWSVSNQPEWNLNLTLYNPWGTVIIAMNGNVSYQLSHFEIKKNPNNITLTHSNAIDIWYRDRYNHKLGELHNHLQLAKLWLFSRKTLKVENFFQFDNS